MVGIAYPQISPANVLLFIVWSFLGSDFALVKPPFYTTGRQPTRVECHHKRWGGFPAVSGVAWRRFRSDVPCNLIGFMVHGSRPDPCLVSFHAMDLLNMGLGPSHTLLKLQMGSA